MTHDNRRQAIQQELRQCAAALRAARALRDMGLCNDALSRLYYALYHATTALLLTEGVEPRRHRSIAGLLSAHFLRAGVLTAEEVAVVGRTQSYRDLADYERAWEATPAIAADAFASVEPLIARIEEVLERGGWTRPPSG